MSIAMGTRLHINLYIYKTTSVPILVLLSQNAQSDEKVFLSRCTIMQIVRSPTGSNDHGRTLSSRVTFHAKLCTDPVCFHA